MKFAVHVEGKTMADIGKELAGIAAGLSSVKPGKTSKKKEEEETFSDDDSEEEEQEASGEEEEESEESEEEEESDDAPTHEALVAAFAKYAKKTSKDKAIARLNKLGYTALTKVKEKDRAKVIAAVSKA